MQETLSLGGQDVPAIMSNFVYKVGLAREHREFLVTVYCVYRLHVDTLYIERLQGFGNNDTIGRNRPRRNLFEAGPRQNKYAFPPLRQGPDRRNVAVIAVMMRHKCDVDFR